jgi:hypothetical protein
MIRWRHSACESHAYRKFFNLNCLPIKKLGCLKINQAKKSDKYFSPHFQKNDCALLFVCDRRSQFREFNAK